MKKTILFLFYGMFFFVAKSQITFDQNDFIRPGLQLKKFQLCVSCDTSINSGNFTLGSGSAAEYYNFAALNNYTPNDTMMEEYSYPFLTPLGNNHQMANVAIAEDNELALDQSMLSRVDLFAVVTSNEYKIVSASFIRDSLAYFTDSSISSASGKYDSVNINLAEPIRIISTGHEYGTFFTDTAFFSYLGLNGVFQISETHTRTVTVDGYGILTLSTGTYNVLRFKVIEYAWERIDSSGVLWREEQKTNISFEYWAKGFGDAIVKVEVEIDTSVTGYKILNIEWISMVYSYGDSLCKTDCVWPGDVNGDLNVNHYDLLPLGLNFSKTGSPRDYETNHWMAFNATDWADTLRNGENMKHADCNGDSLINFDDIVAIKQNFQMAFYKANNSSQYNASNPDLYFDVLSGDIAPGSSVEIALMGGKEDFSLYGLGFEVKIDPNLYEAGTLNLKWESNWLGTANVDMMVIKKINEATGEIFAACVRNNNKSATSHGELARISFKVSEDIVDSTNYGLEASTSGGVDSTGGGQSFNGSKDTLTSVFSIKKNNKKNNIKIYPNPTQGLLTLDLPSSSSYSYEIFNILGKVVKASDYYLNGFSKINLSDLQEGIYLIKIITDKGEIKTFSVNLQR